METDSATLRPVLAGTRSASTDADGLLPSSPTIARFPGLRLLGLDAHGRALDWMSWQDATCLYARGAVAWTLGEPCLEIHGGICRASGEQSIVRLHPIIAARGHARPQAFKDAKRETARFYFARLLPRTLSHKAAIESGAAPLMSMPAELFGD